MLFLEQVNTILAQQRFSWDELARQPSVLHGSDGIKVLSTNDFIVKLSNYTQAINSFLLKKDTSWDFTTGNRLDVRKISGMNFLGDINLKWKPTNTEKWFTYNSARYRFSNGVIKSAKANVLASCILSLPDTAKSYLQIERTWENASFPNKGRADSKIFHQKHFPRKHNNRCFGISYDL